MLHAVAQGKAHRFFDKARLDTGPSGRRPQEDMVTSALFGSIAFLPDEDRRAALDLLLGGTCERALPEGDIEIDLWRSFPDPDKALGRVEPDVLLTCGGRTVIVEVKWHSGLGPDQLGRQFRASTNEGRDVTAIVVLGTAILPDGADRLPVRPSTRTWQEVSTALARESDTAPLGRWRTAVRGFLQRTDLGHTFAGFAHMRLKDVGTVAPWFGRS